MAKKKVGEMTAAERAEHIRTLEEQGKTQGAPGAHLARATITFTPVNMAFVRAVAKAAGISQSTLINQALDDYRAARPDLMEKAAAFLEAFTGERLGEDAGQGDK